MIRVRITDPEHPHHGLEGLLGAKRTVNGIAFQVKAGSTECFVSRNQILVLNTSKD